MAVPGGVSATRSTSGLLPGDALRGIDMLKPSWMTDGNLRSALVVRDLSISDHLHRFILQPLNFCGLRFAEMYLQAALSTRSAVSACGRRMDRARVPLSLIKPAIPQTLARVARIVASPCRQAVGTSVGRSLGSRVGIAGLPTTQLHGVCHLTAMSPAVAIGERTNELCPVVRQLLNPGASIWAILHFGGGQKMHPKLVGQSSIAQMSDPHSPRH